MRAEILSYISGCEITEVDEIEEMREQLYHLIEVSYSNPSDASNRELGYLWIKFQRDFGEHFAVRHDAVMRSHSLQAGYNEIMRSDDWWEFENLGRIVLFDQKIASEVAAIRRSFDELDCSFAVRDALQKRPFCKCSYGLSREREFEALPERLSIAIQRGLRSYKETLVNEQKKVTPLLEKVLSDTRDPEVSATATQLIDAIRKGDELPRLSLIDLQVLQQALGTTIRPFERPSAKAPVDRPTEPSRVAEEQTISV